MIPPTKKKQQAKEYNKLHCVAFVDYEKIFELGEHAADFHSKRVQDNNENYV